jgi:hypothetical protein
MLSVVGGKDIQLMKCLSASLGSIRLASNVEMQPTLSPTSFLRQSTSSANLLAMKEDNVSLTVWGIQDNNIIVSWEPSNHPSPLLNEKTLKGYRLTSRLQFSVEFSNIPNPIQINIPVYLKVVESDHEFKESAKLLEQFQGLLQERTGEKLNTGSFFSMKITQSDEMDKPATIVAMIDQHKQNLAKLENAIELEKLKQELEFNKKLKADEDATKNLEIMIDTLKTEATEVEDIRTRRRSQSLSTAKKAIAVQLRSNQYELLCLMKWFTITAFFIEKRRCEGT